LLLTFCVNVGGGDNKNCCVECDVDEFYMRKWKPPRNDGFTRETR